MEFRVFSGMFQCRKCFFMCDDFYQSIYLRGLGVSLNWHRRKDCLSGRWNFSWWRHRMETFSALLAICMGNSSVTGEFPVQRPVTWSFDVFFDLGLNERLSKQSWGWWFEMPSPPLWHHSNISINIAPHWIVQIMAKKVLIFSEKWFCLYFLSHNFLLILTHCGLVTPYGGINLGQHCGLLPMASSHYLNQHWHHKRCSVVLI